MLEYREENSRIDKCSMLIIVLDIITYVIDTRKHPTISPDPKLRGSTCGRNFFANFILHVSLSCLSGGGEAMEESTCKMQSL